MKTPNAFSVLQGPVLETQGQLEAVIDAVVRHAFAEVLPTKSIAIGWTAPDAPTQPPTYDTCCTGQAGLLAIGIRHDEKKLPEKALALRVEIAAAKWCEENARDKAPRAIRHEIRERIATELLAATPATPTTAVLLWDTTTGAVFLDGASGPAVSALEELWRVTFTTLPLRPLGLLDRIRDDLSPAQIEHLSVSDVADEHLVMQGARSGQFLGWLWWKGEASTGALPGVDLETGRLQWVPAREVHVLDKGTQKRRLSVRASDAAEDPALRAALIDGHAIESLGLTLQREGQWIADVTLTAKDGEIGLGACKLPPLGEGDASSQAIELAWVIENVHSCCAALLRHWATTAGSEDNLSQSQASMRRWIEMQHRAWLDASATGETN